MKDKKGFTLIELLAVIVILAVIALIATPIILNVIENAKEGSFKSSVYGVIDAASLKITQMHNNDQEVPEIFWDLSVFEYKGKALTGIIMVENSGNTLTVIDISDGEYCASGTLEKLEISKCETPLILIERPEELNDIRNNLSGRYMLSNNVDLSGYSDWEPIGKPGQNSFTGKFYGNNFKITGLKINKPGDSPLGLFGATNNATIRDLKLEDVNITGKYTIGALTGYMLGGIVQNVEATGSIRATIDATETGLYASVGGLIGIQMNSNDNLEFDSSVVENSGVDIEISCPLCSGVGGITGQITGGTIRKSYALGNISTQIGAGGIVGIAGGSGKILIEEVYAANTIEATDRTAAGILSSLNSNVNSENYRIIRNSYVASPLIKQTSSTNVAGILGGTWSNSVDNPVTLTIENTYVRTKFTNNASNIHAYNARSEVIYSNIYYDSEYNNVERVVGSELIHEGITGLTTANMKTSTPFSGWDTNIWNFSNDCYPTLKNVGGNQRDYLGC